MAKASLKHIFPRMRYLLGMFRSFYKVVVWFKLMGRKRKLVSNSIPDEYDTCNTTTTDSEYQLFELEGNLPSLDGSLYICQCLGDPEAFMIGDTNIVKLSFRDNMSVKNSLLWTPAAIARADLRETKHKFDFFGMMYLSTGLGILSYTEGMYLLPDGRIAVTSDIDRPWIIDRKTLLPQSPLGRRDEWMSLMKGSDNAITGDIFSAYANSHVIHADKETGEVFLVNLRYKQRDGSHPVKLIRWNGGKFKHYLVKDHDGHDIEIKQNIHELVCTRDYVLFFDASFITGTEMIFPWKNSPLPYQKTRLFIIRRLDLNDTDSITASVVEIDEPTIHFLANYENPDDIITIYMLHVSNTNTAEMIRKTDRDYQGNLYPEHLIGYGTLPPTDLNSIGRHKIKFEGNRSEVIESKYISDPSRTWAPYLYTYRNRQVEEYNNQDLFVMFKGFNLDNLPRRVIKEYAKKEGVDRKIPAEDIITGKYKQNNSVSRISTDKWEIEDSYEFPDKLLLYTISHIQDKEHIGYIIAGVYNQNPAGIPDLQSNGHEYWVFKEDELSKGPVCKLGHPMLNNTTLFHTLYLPNGIEKKLDQYSPDYHIDLREDYSREEVSQWGNRVLSTFETLIWPYYDTYKSLADLGKYRYVNIGKESLIGEHYVNADNAVQIAELMFLEAERQWSTCGWKKVEEKKGVLVEKKSVSGTFRSSGVYTTRSSGVIDAEAQAVFDMLVSPEGFAVLDPISDPEDHNIPPLEVFDWGENKRLEVAVATTKIPRMESFEFVVLNAIDMKNRIFASKSMLHHDKKGGSIYSDAGETELPRALNTFALKTVDIGNGRCRLLIANFAEMPIQGPKFILNYFNTKMYFKPMYKRIRKKMAEKS
ncbi:MAG: hypothetical protein INQ03_14445 [Candidatus Heimdallarchaeota archaeon]|nr:hypothetical protein [Candidatus Heimdallarchaeota archaeon]